MKQLDLGKSGLMVSEIALGCMRMSDLSIQEASKVIETSVSEGMTFFDHADIYGGGASEEIFASALKQTSIKREEIHLQTKCGIRKGFFDFSKEHIIASVEGSLKRLNTDYVDTLLLHRPDTLMEPAEVAEAFNDLQKSGKVRHFGVSNQNPLQVDLLQKSVDQKLIANQLQFGVMHTGMIDSGINANMKNPASIFHDGGVLEYSRLKEITIQAWSPYQYGMFEGVFLGNEKFPEVNQKIDEIADRYQVSNTTIATAWILRHPANMQTIVGSMNPDRIKQIAQASDIQLSREEWYEIYRAAGNQLP
ncbi:MULTISPECIES: aldo/keto reductase [Carnobacterium]|uniref:aldo/keto reductase n=1 Tax=Carnobacterium TaxID=2747 RepID=UPI001072867E|nr:MULTISPECIES: aldo/keto reductase [Carnobacterium]MDT1939902.1 aldo/keto reductase [Carnobacterium divergens]MDT1942340.1 aldo/keto reductase [Carnobacterium divergens]MDT1948146.1 aldo/keto reductase [Carnobacterium divergens]MDT1950626.1 aldo/keto reductase [Carnobacterium divergens]MDT1955906.1 aldo/keto reductase [Carnobacterium divergens]